jgi:enamine deaminase RidA (YjgF/YER057c/UK114 family)
MERQLISTGSVFEEQVSFSRAVVAGNMVFVAGCTGYDYAKGTISDDLVDQTEQTFQNIINALTRAGSSLSDVVRVTYIVTDPSTFSQCHETIRKHFDGIKPAATVFVAQLLNPSIKIEIEVTAMKG